MKGLYQDYLANGQIKEFLRLSLENNFLIVINLLKIENYKFIKKVQTSNVFSLFLKR